MENIFDFSNKVVFVAGGTSGINLGIAELFAKCGANVAVMSRSQEKVDAAVDKLLSYGNKAAGFVADVREPEAVTNALSGAHQQFGDIDVLISGAAGNFPAPALGMSSNGFKSVIDIDLLGTFNVLRHAFQFLKKPGSSIINISAPQAYQPTEMQTHVCAAKAGVDMVTRCLAMEWGKSGIRINSIAPGPIDDTEGMKRLAPTPEIMQAVEKSVPLGRLGTKDDIANLALLLSTPLTSYISGTVIPVDGGWSLSGFGAFMGDLKKALKIG